jgi:hypothetical protein
MYINTEYLLRECVSCLKVLPIDDLNLDIELGLFECDECLMVRLRVADVSTSCLA